MTYPPTNPGQPYSGQPGYDSPGYPPPPQPGYGTPGYPTAPPSMQHVHVPPQWQNVTPVLNYQITDRVEKGVTQLALMSMIAGFATIPFFCSSPITDNWPVFPALLGIVAAGLGHLALAQPSRAGVSRSNGLAITGLVFGYLTLAISIVWIMLKIKYSN